jgi:hypothetical protein
VAGIAIFSLLKVLYQSRFLVLLKIWQFWVYKQ